MKLTGRRKSSNVEDRRGSGASKGIVGGGIGALIIGVLFMLFSGGGSGSGGIDLGSILGGGGSGAGIDLGSILGGGSSSTSNSNEPYVGSQREEDLKEVTEQILASTEDVWTRRFKSMGKTYKAPTLVFYTGSTQTGCGLGQAAMGPFYCSADENVYIDLSFFMEMQQTLGIEEATFTYAYVLAHEVGHHVQHLLGDLDKAHQQMARLGKAEGNRVSVQIELQADFYAGVWGHDEQKLFNSLEKGDLEKALDAALKIGDDYLQKKAQGRADERTFTHGTSVQRQRWFKRGFQTGDLSQGNTFSVPYNQL